MFYVLFGNKRVEYCLVIKNVQDILPVGLKTYPAKTFAIKTGFTELVVLKELHNTMIYKCAYSEIRPLMVKKGDLKKTNRPECFRNLFFDHCYGEFLTKEKRLHISLGQKYGNRVTCSQFS